MLFEWQRFRMKWNRNKNQVVGNTFRTNRLIRIRNVRNITWMFSTKVKLMQELHSGQEIDQEMPTYYWLCVHFQQRSNKSMHFISVDRKINRNRSIQQSFSNCTFLFRTVLFDVRAFALRVKMAKTDVSSVYKSDLRIHHHSRTEREALSQAPGS